jgi:maleate isomerase
MYGWRARIGISVPCLNTTTEPEFNYLAVNIPGISIHSARMHLGMGDVLTKQHLLDMHATAIKKVIPELGHARVNLIVYACTSGSFVGGTAWDQEIIDAIQQETGIPATTTSTAVLQALHTLGSQRIALGTPYNEDITMVGRKFLEDEGFEVVNSIALDNLDRILAGDKPSLAYELGRKVDTKEADCVFISCTQFPTIDVVSELEADLGKPVVTANLASFWYALKLLSINAPLTGYGALLS